MAAIEDSRKLMTGNGLLKNQDKNLKSFIVCGV